MKQRQEEEAEASEHFHIKPIRISTVNTMVALAFGLGLLAGIILT